MTWILLPEWTPVMIAVHLTFLVEAVAIGPMVRSGAFKMRYSKFRTGTGMSGRTGMFILYFLPVLVLVAWSWAYLPHATTLQWILFAAVGGHFAKRCLEVLLVHKYSGPIDLWTVVQITANYCLLTSLAGFFHARTIAQPDLLFAIGGGLFLIGETGNLWHHVLLARLRTSDVGYQIPQGGLFRFVSSPHYLFEIVAWLGVALMSRHLILLIGWAVMTHYLADRSSATHRWYHERFPDYPADRRRLVPFVF